MTAEAARLRIKTWVCATVVVLCNVFGNFFLKRGMPADLPTPLSYITALFQPWAALGVALLVLWLMSRMALLSWADLSYVLPVTSIGYVMVALAGKAFLHEQIGVKRWSGILLIVAGVALVSAATPPQTEHAAEHSPDHSADRGPQHNAEHSAKHDPDHTAEHAPERPA
jgi:drug/metabolite transporter (DMT)-like permease